MSLQWHAIAAIFKRNFISYFTNPIGYLFITLFVGASAYFAFWHDDAFFATNLADLDRLNLFFPYLLLFFVPAITMTVWAEERRSGTEELLLTLPASDLEIVLGKYLSCLGIYTVALLFSLSHIFVLIYLGDPDRGLMFSTYLGYWFTGAAMLAAGMVASMLSANVTIAFIWGVLLCLMLVSAQNLGTIAVGFFRDWLEQVGVRSQFEPFGNGLVTVGGILYFLSIIAIMLYVNMILLSRRHWGGSDESAERWTHYGIRTVCLAVVAVCLTVMSTRVEAILKVDVTEEQIHNLSPDTIAILEKIDPKRPVYIEAFLSPEVPQAYVQTRKNLVDLLRQFDSIGGNNVEVRIRDTEQFSDAARDADRVYGIKAEPVQTQEDARIGIAEVFLGVVCKSGLNEKKVPFFYPGLPVEYELTRMVRTVSETAKRKIGILTTDAGLFGQFNFQTFQPAENWMIVGELQQQYDVVQIASDAEITEKVDVLVVPLASSLTQTQLGNLIDYVKKGNPTLILDDPMPIVNPDLAARAPKPRPRQQQMFGGGQPPPIPKGNLRDLTDLLNIDFDAGSIIWQDWNPHPQYKDLPPEYLFVGAGSGARHPFNPDSSITAGLQELILFYTGAIRDRGGDGPAFTPLLTTNNVSGTMSWDDMFSESFLGRTPNPNPRRRLTRREYVLAAEIKGPASGPDKATPSSADESDDAKKDEKKAKDEPANKDIHVIFIADLDMISDFPFNLRRRGEEQLNFDNVSFVLNCVDTLAGDNAFVSLRKKRPQRRTLTHIEQMVQNVSLEARKREEEASTKAKEEKDKAQKQLDDAVEAIDKRTDIDRRTKEQLKETERRTLQRKLDVQNQEIEADLRSRLQGIRNDLQRAIKVEERTIKLWSVLLPPVPALLIGIVIFFARLSGEKEGVDPNRLV